MPVVAGRKVRISLGATAIAGARVDSLTINREHIDMTDKDDLGVRQFLTEIGTHSMSMTVSGLLTTDALIVWAANPATVLQTMTFTITGIGAYTGSFGLSSFEHSGEEGASAATFSATFESSGSVPFTAAGG